MTLVLALLVSPNFYPLYVIIDLANPGHDVAHDHWDNGVGMLSEESIKPMISNVIPIRRDNVSTQLYECLVY